MTNEDIIRAWTDPEYRATLSPADLAALPANPAGGFELNDAELDAVSGAATGVPCGTQGRSDCCWSATTCNEFCDL